MNAIVKALVQPRFWYRFEITRTQVSWAWVLAILMLLTSLGIVFAKDINRRTFIQYQQLQTNRAAMQVQHDRLLLESSTWLAQSRLANRAQDLGMVVPNDKQTVWLGAGDKPGVRSNNH